jgi:hypothetical protein
MKSKQAEIDQFLRFQKRCESGSYLDGILKGMEGYVIAQIQNDTAIPIIHYANLNDERVVKAESRSAILDGNLQTAAKEMLRLQERVEFLESEVANLTRTAEGYRDDLGTEGDRLIAERLKVSALEKELTLTKARMFDELLIERKLWMEKIEKEKA